MFIYLIWAIYECNAIRVSFNQTSSEPYNKPDNNGTAKNSVQKKWKNESMNDTNNNKT